MGALSDFIFQSKYSKYIPSLERKETWEESVERISNMHQEHLNGKYPEVLSNASFTNMFLETIDAYKSKKFIGSQRALQFGGTPILHKNEKIFNCSALYADKLSVFKDVEYLLLCGVGVGASVENQHINKLPKMVDCLSKDSQNYVISDSIEGWALAFGALINHFFVPNTQYPIFDYSEIRPEGSLISGGFLAPGPSGLKKALSLTEELLRKVFKGTKKLSPLNVTDILGYEADSVLSGGVRRSAMIILFDPDNEEMFNCKTGNWFYDNPQRARFNMSAVLERGKTSKEVFNKIFQATKEYGEPGFFWRNDSKIITNPCCEVGFKPITKSGKTGIQFCNLVTINGALVESAEDFYKSCRYASFLATIQATYNKFPFLGEVTEELAKEDPLIGVSIGGIMSNPDILLDPKVLKEGAKIVKETNKITADILGINPSSRCCVLKPDGNSSVLLEMTPGCHGEHARHYIRRVQVNKFEEAGIAYRKLNPKAVVDSIWSNNNTDWCIMFPITASKRAYLKKDLLGIKQLEIVKSLFSNWIVEGQRDPQAIIQNNVSNTVQVPDSSWEEVKDFVWDNQYEIAGVSFVPESIDTTFNQPPYTEVLMPEELLKRYGEGVIFASGLIVDVIDAFGDLWKACDILYGKGEQLHTTYKEAEKFKNNYDLSRKELFLDKSVAEYEQAKEEQYHRWIHLYTKMGYSDNFAAYLVQAHIELPVSEYQKYLDGQMFGTVHKLAEKRDLIRRINKFSCKYFDCNLDKTVESLKQVQLYHDWCEITKSYVSVDWSKVKWSKVNIEANTTAAASCNGGSCEITKV